VDRLIPSPFHGTIFTMPFLPDQTGYIRHWLVIPEHTAPYEGEPGTEPDLRKQIVEPIGQAPIDVTSGSPGPYDSAWEFYDPGQNIFVEQSGFWHNLSVLNTYGVTHLIAPQAGTYKARFWSCGAGDLWIDGNHVTRNMGLRYMYPDPVDVNLELNAGVCELACRIQALGVRDTRLLFGLQLLERADGFQVRLPGPESQTETLRDACDWLDSLRVLSNTCIAANSPAPATVTVKSKRTEDGWPSDGDRFDLPTGAEKVDVNVIVDDQLLTRTLEIPANWKIEITTAKTVEEAQSQYISVLASREGKGRGGVMNVLARHAIGDRNEADTSIIEGACDWIDDRPDCADFPLSALLRLMVGTTLTEVERDRIKQTALGFRYWYDEPGNDALCFGSENHSLLFHGCQMIAGDLFPDETFTNCDRKGAEQARIGRERCSDWLDLKEKEGFDEFLSSTYIPLTVAAILNVVDFANDDEMSAKAWALVDRLFTVIAEHAFDGVTVGPQGRVYRNVLVPDASGTQALLSYTTPYAVASSNDWASFLGASEGYTPPENLAEVMSNPVSKTYSEASVEITLEKTADYLLTSLQIPASWQTEQSRVDPPFRTKGLIPGRQGYQQHLWHATLGRDCHIFVNHPGATFDMSSSRPGFWYGNGFLPKLAQKDNVLAQVFNTPDDHPIPFTHAHWPIDSLDESDIQPHWAFGRKGSGCIGLWCSQPLTLRSEVLTDHELRAESRQVAWMCFCGPGSLDNFKANCLSTNPTFDTASLTLTSDTIDLAF
jgi:hypothetical protein